MANAGSSSFVLNANRANKWKLTEKILAQVKKCTWFCGFLHLLDHLAKPSVFPLLAFKLFHQDHMHSVIQSPLHNVLFGQYVFLPTEQAETYLKIYVLIYH